MTDSTATKPASSGAQKTSNLKTDLRADKVMDLRQKVTGVGALRIRSISGTPEAANQVLTSEEKSEVSAHDAIETDDTATHVTQPVLIASTPRLLTAQPTAANHLYQTATILTVMWLAFFIGYVALSWSTFVLSPPVLGALLAGLFAPPALGWLTLSVFQRHADAQRYAEALRLELHNMLFPTDETALVINKNIQKLCEQAAEVTGASQTVLKSLQQARQGLRMEVRDFSGVSKKAEFHIERLAETLADRSEKMAAMISQIEERVARVDEKAGLGALAWEQATNEILKKVSEIEASMGRGADQILTAADRARDKNKAIQDDMAQSYDQLQVAIDTIAKRFDEIKSNFDTQKTELSTLAEHVTGETTKLGDIIKSQVGSLDEVTQITLSAMEKSGHTLQQHKDALNQAARNASDHAGHIASSIESSVNKLQASVDHVVSRTEGLEERIASKTADLRNIIRSSFDEAEKIESAGSRAATKLQETLGIISERIDSVNSTVKSASELLSLSGQGLTEQAETVQLKIKDSVLALDEATQNNSNMLNTLAERLKAEEEKLDAAINSRNQQVQTLVDEAEARDNALAVSVAWMGEQIDKTRQALSDPLADIRAALNEADTKHQLIADVLQRRVTDLSDVTSKAITASETIRDTLKSQVHELSSLSGEVTGHARSMNEEITRHTQILKREAEEAHAKVRSVADTLAKQSENVKAASELATNNVRDLSNVVLERHSQLTSFSQDTVAKLEQVAEAIQMQSDSLQEKAAKAGNVLKDVNSVMESTAERFQPAADKMIENAENVSKRYEDLAASYETSAASNLEKLQKIGVVFDERLISLKQGSHDAANILRTSGDYMHQRVSDIQQASEAASRKMNEISSSLEGQTADIHLATDQVMLKIERVQKAFAEQFHEFSASVGQAVTQLDNAGHHFVKQSGVIKDESQVIASNISSISQTALEHTRDIEASSRRAVQENEKLCAAIRREADTLLQQAGDALNQLVKIGDTFGIRAREVSEQMKSAQITSEQYTQTMRQHSTELAEATQNATQTMHKTANDIITQISNIGRVSQATQADVRVVRDQLAVEAERLMSVSGAALDTAREAVTTFGRQSESLFKATEDAADFLRDVKTREARVQREAFLSSAKFIIESLHSLSVDTTRLLDGEISEKTWKAFQKGDIAAFTRRLAELSLKTPSDKIRGKFENDTEFRTYILRYIRQFEEMYDQALESDHGALLSATIGSSEVARLYGFLCQVAGRESRLSASVVQAA